MMGLGKRARIGAIVMALLAVIALPIPALALLVRPVLMDLLTTGAGANGSFEVSNDRNRAITVEIAVNTLAIPERGDVVLTKNDGADFQIFPPIASIPAGGRQVFRVRWIGDAQLPQSKLFMFTTTELPLSTEQPTTGGSVQVLYAINSVVAVKSVDTMPKISIGDIKRVTPKDGKPGLEITFINDGPSHGYVTNARLELSVKDANWSKTLEPSDLNNAFGLGLVPPNAKRVMYIALPDVPATGAVTADIKPLSDRGRSGL